MVEMDANRALLNVYRNHIIRYRKMLKTQLTVLERNYIKERLSAFQAAVNALTEPEAIWGSTSNPSESRQRTIELR